MKINASAFKIAFLAMVVFGLLPSLDRPGSGPQNTVTFPATVNVAASTIIETHP